MEKIWFAEYQKTGIPETVTLPAENTSLVDIFERNFQNLVLVMPLSLWIKPCHLTSWSLQAVSSRPICKIWG